MCAILQLVSAPLNPVPIEEQFRRSHPLSEHSNSGLPNIDFDVIRLDRNSDRPGMVFCLCSAFIEKLKKQLLKPNF